MYTQLPLRLYISGCSETRFLGSRPRPRLCFFESQWRDKTETFFLLSLNIETRPRLFFSESQCRDETETFFLLSLNVETRPRLYFSESQYRDETETFFFELTKVVEQVLKVFFAKNLRTKNLGS